MHNDQESTLQPGDTHGSILTNEGPPRKRRKLDNEAPISLTEKRIAKESELHGAGATYYAMCRELFRMEHQIDETLLEYDPNNPKTRDTITESKEYSKFMRVNSYGLDKGPNYFTYIQDSASAQTSSRQTRRSHRYPSQTPASLNEPPKEQTIVVPRQRNAPQESISISRKQQGKSVIPQESQSKSASPNVSARPRRTMHIPSSSRPMNGSTAGVVIQHSISPAPDPLQPHVDAVSELSSLTDVEQEVPTREISQESAPLVDSTVSDLVSAIAFSLSSPRKRIHPTLAMAPITEPTSISTAEQLIHNTSQPDNDGPSISTRYSTRARQPDIVDPQDIANENAVGASDRAAFGGDLSELLRSYVNLNTRVIKPEDMHQMAVKDAAKFRHADDWARRRREFHEAGQWCRVVLDIRAAHEEFFAKRNTFKENVLSVDGLFEEWESRKKALLPRATQQNPIAHGSGPVNSASRPRTDVPTQQDLIRMAHDSELGNSISRPRTAVRGSERGRGRGGRRGRGRGGRKGQAEGGPTNFEDPNSEDSILKARKALAKHVSSLVVAEWRKAVYMIRQRREEKELVEAEEEDLRRMNELLEASKSHLEEQDIHFVSEEEDSDDEDPVADDEDSVSDDEDSSSIEDDESPVVSREEPNNIDTYPTPPDSSMPPDGALNTNITTLDNAQMLSPFAGTESLFTEQEQEPCQGDTDVEDTGPDAQSFSASTIVDGDTEDGKAERDGEESTQTPASAPSPPSHLAPYAYVPVDWEPQKKIKIPFLLRGTLRSYQLDGFRWLAKLHSRHHDGLLADEMGLGKTIQTITLLAHLAERGVWGPHLIVVPKSVVLNWEMEFKKFLPGFKVVSYYGNTKQRTELRMGWRKDKFAFNVCITSYNLAVMDERVFKSRHWYYMILDEAHMIKNHLSQRWMALLLFKARHRLLLTGTPVQNKLEEFWSLLQFILPEDKFSSLKDFSKWFSNPIESSIEAGDTANPVLMDRTAFLQNLIRPHTLRREKKDVEKELPQKIEHIVLCPLSKRQRLLYDEFMSRATTQEKLQSGGHFEIANILMQLRKVCNHPDLFEVRPVVTSYVVQNSVVASYSKVESLLRRSYLPDTAREDINSAITSLGLRFCDRLDMSNLTQELAVPDSLELPQNPPPFDTQTIPGFKAYSEWQDLHEQTSRTNRVLALSRLRASAMSPLDSSAVTRCSGISTIKSGLVSTRDLLAASEFLDIPYIGAEISVMDHLFRSYSRIEQEYSGIIDRFCFATPVAIVRDIPSVLLGDHDPHSLGVLDDSVLHRSAVKLQIAFPNAYLLQHDCGKLNTLASLLRQKRQGGHRVLIFTQMTKILDILEIFLNLHGHLYLRLDGQTKVEDRQYITERFNADERIFCFIASSRSGGVGINLTGADTVIFYDSDFNPQMDRQCEDRAHRIGQVRNVHIYRLVSEHTVEEALLRKANQKRHLDNLVIRQGQFDWRTAIENNSMSKAMEHFDDHEDAEAAANAAAEARNLEDEEAVASDEPKAEEIGVAGFMLSVVDADWESFSDWRI